MVTPGQGKVRRDREGTERRILEATGRLLARDGFRGLGVNAVARDAGADKVLVYRYFGGLAGLLEAYARSADFWPAEEELVPAAAGTDPATTVAATRSAQAHNPFLGAGAELGLRRPRLPAHVLRNDSYPSSPRPIRSKKLSK